ncbi:MAG: extracellular solute-binding protein, partial [Sciscionella sp.]|nr:extracellular solute-binding protein [Sciscionella sp.]
YETLPTFAAGDELQDISQYANGAKSQFVPWTWNQVSLQGQVFGIPVDTGPEALFYRKDLYTKYGLAVPKTWDEFAADAKKLHTADPGAYLSTSPQDAYELSGLAWQNGAHWFGTSGNQWKVTINDAASKKVAQYWDGLLSQKLVKNEPSWDTAVFADLNSSKVISLIGAVWGASLLSSNVPNTSGKWAVAPMPQWTAGADVAGNQGGSSTAVLKGCANPQQAEQFAQWMSTDSGSVTNLIKNTGIYPAATSGLSNPELSKPSPYFGNQNIYDVFKDAATHTNTDWQWGPTMDQVESDFTDALKTAGNGSSTVTGSLDTVQTKTVAALKNQGLQVSGS